MIALSIFFGIKVLKIQDYHATTTTTTSTPTTDTVNNLTILRIASCLCACGGCPFPPPSFTSSHILLATVME